MDALIKLSQEHIKSLENLFLEAFYDNHFYIQLFPENRKQKMIDAFYLTIDYIISENLSWGYFIDGELAGYIMNIDYKKIENDPVMLAKIFGGSENPDDNPYYEEIDVPIQKLQKCLYILTCAVSEKYRGRGIARKLIQKTVNEHNTIACDIANPFLYNHFRNLGFNVSEIDEDYWLAILNK